MPQLSNRQVDFMERHLGVEFPEAPPVTPEENAILLEMTPEELVDVDLTIGDMDEIFGEEYMIALMDAPIKGEGDPKLGELMRELAKGLGNDRRPSFMEDLSAVVGTPPTAEKLDVDYDRFLVLQMQQEGNEVKGGKEEVPDLDEDKHPEFMASRGQLLFGKVLGDAFDIHEVFAAMLSATGGLVGPGNSALQLDPDNPVSLHGTVHDAAGYLLNYHQDGPGYNYRESSLEILSSDNPLAGQHSGIAFWVDVKTREAVTDEIKDSLQKYVDAADFAAVMAHGAAASVAAGVEHIHEAAHVTEQAVMQSADEAADAVEAAADEMAQSVADSARSGAKSVAAGADAAADKIRDMAEAVHADFIGDAADATADAVETAAHAAADAAAFVAETSAEVAKGAANAGAGAVKFVADKTEDAVSLAADAAEKAAEMAADATQAAADALEKARDVSAEVTGYLSGKIAGAVSEVPLKLGVDITAGLMEAKTQAMNLVDSIKSGFDWFSSSATEPAPEDGKDPVDDSKAISEKAKEERSIFSSFIGF